METRLLEADAELKEAWLKPLAVESQKGDII